MAKYHFWTKLGIMIGIRLQGTFGIKLLVGLLDFWTKLGIMIGIRLQGTFGIKLLVGLLVAFKLQEDVNDIWRVAL
jgi:hypothetical protein